MDILNNLGIEAYPAIVIICLLIGFLCKASPLDDRWIPIVCGFCGGILGVVAMIVSENFPTHDPFMAVAVGILSGFAATVRHQAVWQWLKDKVSGPTPAEAAEEKQDYTGEHE